MSFIFSLIYGISEPHIKGTLDLKVGLLFHRMFALFLCLHYMFGLNVKSSLYFPFYVLFITSKYNSPLKILFYVTVLCM